MERGSGHNDKLDLWKCVAIYSVIFIHILLPGQIGVAVNCLARFAVPLFFLSAGFFSWRSPPRVLARPDGPHRPALLLFACLALLGLGCAMAKHGGASMGAYLLGRFTWANAASLVLWQLFPLPYSWPLWFLAALLMIYLMWWGLTALLLGRLPHRLLAVLALGLLGRPPGAGGGPEPPGAGSGQRAHPKRVAGRPALLPPGHLDGIAAGADRGPAAGLALAGGGGGVPSGAVGAQPHGIPGPPCGDGAGRGVRDGGLCGRSGGEKPGAEEDRLPLRGGS